MMPASATPFHAPNHEFLVKTVGGELVDNVMSTGLKHFKWRNDPYIPVEFSVAAYRFGHSQIRPSYRGNFGTSKCDPGKQFFAFIFDQAAADPNDPADLRGGRRASRRFITGRRSSTSATAGCDGTRRSTPRCRRRCST